jgi:hypothetical protein
MPPSVAHRWAGASWILIFNLDSLRQFVSPGGSGFALFIFVFVTLISCLLIKLVAFF